jgi:hypothetical protein
MFYIPWCRLRSGRHLPVPGVRAGVLPPERQHHRLQPHGRGYILRVPEGYRDRPRQGHGQNGNQHSPVLQERADLRGSRAQ